MKKDKRSTVSKFFIFFLFLCLVPNITHALEGDKNIEILKLINELKSNDNEIREHAKLNLIKPVFFNRLKEFHTELVQNLTDYKISEESCILLGLLSLPEGLSKALLLSDQTPDKVKARLGDKYAEERVINKFQNSTNLAAKRKYSIDLLYIGSENALKVFANALESNEYYTDYLGNKISLAQVMIQSYWQVNPHIKLFSSEEYAKHSYISKNEFLLKEHQEYLRNIEKYFKENYKLEIQIKTPFLILGEPKVEEYLIKKEEQ